MIGLLLLGVVGVAVASAKPRARPLRAKMRGMQFSHVDTRGRAVFVATAEGRELGDVVCPTGQTCKHACACSGVSASGVVGVGGKCKCISIARPPNPAAPRLPLRARARP